MLIMPRSASEVQCEKLKLNVDYSENAGSYLTVIAITLGVKAFSVSRRIHAASAVLD